MKELIFNDGRNIEIQSIGAAGEGILHVRLILTTTEQLKALFRDEFATEKMTVYENHTQKEVYENYTKLSYLKEEAGGIWEVEMLQKEADLTTRIAKLEQANEELMKQNAELMKQNDVLQGCILEMSELVYQ